MNNILNSGLDLWVSHLPGLPSAPLVSFLPNLKMKVIRIFICKIQCTSSSASYVGETNQYIINNLINITKEYPTHSTLCQYALQHKHIFDLTTLGFQVDVLNTYLITADNNYVNFKIEIDDVTGVYRHILVNLYVISTLLVFLLGYMQLVLSTGWTIVTFHFYVSCVNRFHILMQLWFVSCWHQFSLVELGVSYFATCFISDLRLLNVFVYDWHTRRCVIQAAYSTLISCYQNYIHGPSLKFHCYEINLLVLEYLNCVFCVRIW